MSTFPALKRFRVAIAQEVVHTIIIEAADADDAWEIAEERYREQPGILAYTPPEDWEVHSNEWEVCDCEQCASQEVQS